MSYTVTPCTPWQPNTRLPAVFLHGFPCVNMAESISIVSEAAVLVHGFTCDSMAGKYAFARCVLTRFSMYEHGSPSLVASMLT